MTKNSY